MTALQQENLWRQPGLRVQTLVRLRWLAVLGQSLALLIVHFWLGFELPFWPAMGIVLLSAWLNVALMLRWQGGARLKENAAMAVLAFDIVQLAILLYLTGGLANPFSLLFLAPVTVSATSLATWRTLLLGLLALMCITALAFVHLPLPWKGEPPRLPLLYLFGMWGALASGLIFTGLYVHRIARENWQMAEALRATELVLARQQQLYALDGLAAAAAHELSTPLATISVVAREMRKECCTEAQAADDDEERKIICEDLELIHSQAERCRDILRQLAEHRARRDEMLARARVGAMLEEIIEPLRGPDVHIALTRRPAEGAADGSEPLVRREPGVFYGLGNIIENACDFAERHVMVEAEWDNERISITVTDDGPGFSEEIMSRLGEPFVTSRGQQFLDNAPEFEDGEVRASGMGLGFFIAKTLLERSGATVSIANRPAPMHGAIVRIDWPRSAIEATAHGARHHYKP